MSGEDPYPLSYDRFARLVRACSSAPRFADPVASRWEPVGGALDAEVDLQLLALGLEASLDVSLPTPLVESLCCLDDLFAYCRLAIEHHAERAAADAEPRR